MKIWKPFILLAYSIIACLGSELIAQDTIRLKVLVTSDIHGHFLPYDLFENRARTNSLAQVYSFVKNERSEQGQEVVLLDNGDLLQGDPLIYYYNFIDTAGFHPLAQMMNFMKYDGATVGNHDIEAGHPVYDKLVQQFSFPWMAANIINESTGEPYFKPYTIINRSNLKIAVLGLCTPSVPKWLPKDLWSDMIFEDMLLSARKWVDYIENTEEPDILIGLFHSGAPERSFTEAELPMLEDASRLIAQKVSGFDVVFSGHDHRLWNIPVTSPSGKAIYILGSGSNSHNVAVAEMLIITDNENQIISKNVIGNIRSVTKLQADKDFTENFSHFLEPVKNYLKEPVTILKDTLFSRDCLFGSAEFVNLIHHIQLKITGADISFCAPLTFNTILPSGEINIADMFKLYRFENQLYTMRLSGKEILDALEYNYSNWMNQMMDTNDHLLNFKKNDKGETKTNSFGQPETVTPFYNFESAAGIFYTVDVSKPAGSRITIHSMANGEPFNPGSFYIVAVNSYRGSGGGGHLTEGSGIASDELYNRTVWTSGKDLRSMLSKWLITNPMPSEITEVQWNVIPESWYEKGRKKDYELLFKH